MIQTFNADHPTDEEKFHRARLEHQRQARLRELRWTELLEGSVLDLLTACLGSLVIYAVLGVLAWLAGTDLYVITLFWALLTLVALTVLFLLYLRIQPRIRERRSLLSMVEGEIIYLENGGGPGPPNPREEQGRR